VELLIRGGTAELPHAANSGLEWATRQPNPASSLFILDLGRNVMTTAII